MSTAIFQAESYTPPRPMYPVERPCLRQFLRAARTNALLIWPNDAYERDVLVNRLLGRTRMLINTPEAIHRVLVENPGNYRRIRGRVTHLHPTAQPQAATRTPFPKSETFSASNFRGLSIQNA